MTGRELYEMSRELYEDFLVGPFPSWEELTPFRQANWNATAADYVRKRLDDEAEDRMTDEGGPPPGEDY